MRLWGDVWDIQGILDDTDRTSPTIRKKDVRKLQTLQNTVLRLQTGLAKGTATEYLMHQSGQLSVHQLSTYFSILQVHNCKNFKATTIPLQSLILGGGIVQE